jgi:error-prone DNA polymerase
MGFYGPSTVIKDAQRHGLRMLPIDINQSRAICTVEDPCVRLGFNYVRGLNKKIADAMEASQPFGNIADLSRRVPELSKADLETLAAIGALNPIGARHRRDALWQASWLSKPAANLLGEAPEPAAEAPLKQMTLDERLVSDHAGIGFSIGKHPMSYRRAEMDKLRVIPAAKLPSIPHGRIVRVAGNIIVRQRPGTAKGILFLSLEDDTGISNIVVKPELFASQRLEILANPWVMVEGKMQNVDNVIHVLARRVRPLPNPLEIAQGSHDFH